METVKLTIIEDYGSKKEYRLIHTETNEVIGGCSVTECDSDYKIFHVKILESFQGNGYGTLMLKYIIKEYESKGKPLWLWVSKDNRIAISLYKKLGFKIIREPYEDRFEMLYKY